MVPMKINVLLFQEDSWWSAQCLEYDIATQAKTLPDVLYEIQRVLVGHFVVANELGQQEPFAGIAQAPKKCWERFEQSMTRVGRPPGAFTLPKPAPFALQDVRVAELPLAA